MTNPWSTEEGAFVRDVQTLGGGGVQDFGQNHSYNGQMIVRGDQKSISGVLHDVP